jgi:hypothetical protein
MLITVSAGHHRGPGHNRGQAARADGLQRCWNVVDGPVAAGGALRHRQLNITTGLRGRPERTRRVICGS